MDAYNANDILRAIDEYMGGDRSTSESRYTSFDYCYNYFYSFYKTNNIKELSSERHLQTSCLQLGFFLASWGMFRGSSILLQKSSRYYSRLIKYISNRKPKLWEIDVDTYNDENIKLLINTEEEISNIIKNKKDENASVTLTTKIMLGVFGNIPAFDTYVKKTYKINTVNEKTLYYIKDFYEKNKITFDKKRIQTLDFNTGKQNTGIYYPKVKLIDMYGTIKGKEMSE